VKVDSVAELTAAFDEWRKKKKHAREAMPQELVERARRTARVHGARRVTEAVKLDNRRLRGLPAARGASKQRVETGARMPVPVPGYSRVELTGTVGGRPLAELEMPSGVKVRVYAATEEMLSLVSRVCAGGER
jgi:hypothetical protein